MEESWCSLLNKAAVKLKIWKEEFAIKFAETHDVRVQTVQVMMSNFKVGGLRKRLW